MVRATSKYAERSSRTSSASRPSESVVKPTRSAKSTDTRRRSAAAAGRAGAASAARGLPHSPQKRAPGSFGEPQAGQARASGAPHSPQNLRPSAFSVPQEAQRTTPRSVDRAPPRGQPLVADRGPRDTRRMARKSRGRFLTTVLFLDLVGSTATASRLGDSAWRNLLGRFRAAVRAELRRFDGRESDTTGDGFLAVFAQPAQAVRAAAAIVAAAQTLGLDVRVGLHTGECEEIDGGLAGVAVHIGARVMSLAGAAEVVATQTVHDLVHGAGFEFEPRGEHRLKGVDGSWRVSALRTVDREPLRAPLD